MESLEWLAMVRHGESTANVASDEAAARGLDAVDITLRDADVPLSQVGREQAVALGRRLAALPADERPTAVLSSPYLRASDTARIALEQLADPPPIVLDERLRDREMGALYMLTLRGIETRHPEEVERKRRLGKFYYRPPGGESWADMALRLRSVLADIDREYPRGRILVVAHDAIVVLTRYIIERLSEEELLDVERTLVANGSLTIWARENGGLRLVTFNDTDHLKDADLAP
ncbi:histidine phosphatase family protein [Actinoallomurus purpureus]|uniref:histidine phosphatase family protein n=1 Tax=Actinoallomurus purpureus TaxID=478114 RepID=UPI0020922BC3|nr:histidine phosphatase family protein [Actinoallomurus purpureus]MCO6006088.1 histidine phosphatase family protein [Actinoallomurus purpureus]